MELIKFDQTKLKIVPIEQVTPNTWNPKEKGTPEYEKIKKAIQTNGQKAPIIVRTLQPDQYEIIDGEQRYTALKELGASLILIYDEGTVSDKEAKELTIWWQQQVPFKETDLAFLISKLVAEYKEVNLPFSDAELQNFLELANFDWTEYKMDLSSNETATEDKADTIETTNFKTIEVRLTADKYLKIKRFIEENSQKDFINKLTDSL